MFRLSGHLGYRGEQAEAEYWRRSAAHAEHVPAFGGVSAMLE